MSKAPAKTKKARLDETCKRALSIAATLPDVVWSVTAPSNEVYYVSPAAKAVFGKSARRMMRSFSEWVDLIHPDDLDRTLAAWESATRGAPLDVEYRIVTPQGAVRWIQTRSRSTANARGSIVRVDGIARDITAQREQDTRIAHLNRIRAVLGGISSTIARVRGREELLREACRIAVEQGGFGMAWIGLLDAAGREVTIAAQHGFGLDAPRSFIVPAEDDPDVRDWVPGRAILERRPLVDQDLEARDGDLLAQLAVRQGYRSLIALPLFADGVTIGVAVLYARESDSFDDDESKFLVELARDISFALEHIAKEAKLQYLSNYDPLTGLANRARLQEQLAKALDASRRTQTHTALAIADIRHFRLVNETFGRHAGDMVLRELAQRLRAHWPEPDGIARILADAFCFVLPVVEDPPSVADVLKKHLSHALAAPIVIDGREITIAMTTGIAVFPPDGDDPDVLVRNAEAALKRAKASNERMLFYRPEMNARVAETLLLEHRLRRAVERDEFVLHYQPKIAAASGNVTGFEALIRWRDPVSGMVPPGRFIPVLEETGLIVDVGAWAIRKALIDSRDWRLPHGGPLRIAVNVSPIELRQRDYVETVKRAIGGLDVGVSQIDLELTEGAVMEDIDANALKLSALREMGVNLAVDDFGTGYSSLGYLAKLPINSLKIDRSFVDTMARSSYSMTLVSTIISLAHALDLKVIAEGVETEEQAKLLRLLKCDELQGYLFSTPLAPGQVPDFLAAPGTKA